MNLAVKVIKKKTHLSELPFDDDRAVTDFHAFRIKADAYLSKIRTPEALDAIEDVVDHLKASIERRRS